MPKQLGIEMKHAIDYSRRVIGLFVKVSRLVFEYLFNNKESMYLCDSAQNTILALLLVQSMHYVLQGFWLVEGVYETVDSALHDSGLEGEEVDQLVEDADQG